jgi:isochorismate synthase
MSLIKNRKEEKRALENYPKDEILKAALNAAVESKLPIAFWQLPQSRELNFLIAFTDAIKLNKLDLEETGSGFSFSPFDVKKESLFINNNFHCSFIKDKVQLVSDSVSGFESIEEEFLKAFYNHLEVASSSKTKFHEIRKPNRSDTNPNDYLKLVELTITAIKNEQFQKAVPARQIEIPLHRDFDPIDTFLKLSSSYENAFTSLVSIPKTGTWLGATPEVLLEVDASNTFKTVALAATQKRDFEKSTEETAWTQKEIEEQAMVSRYIINCFKKIRLREFEEKGPKTVVAGNLLHLKTEYKVDMAATNFPQLGTVMLDLLHPTSAVAGMPKENVLSFLEKNEGFERDFFSGYLGPVNINNSTNIFVNLRCMQIFNESAFLYAGAGITEDSNPEKELHETELKFNTLLNIINNKN